MAGATQFLIFSTVFGWNSSIKYENTFLELLRSSKEIALSPLQADGEFSSISLGMNFIHKTKEVFRSKRVEKVNFWGFLEMENRGSDGSLNP